MTTTTKRGAIVNRESVLRAACASAERDGVLVSVVLDEFETVWVRSERAEGFDRLFALRARRDHRCVSRVHLSVDDVAAFEFERSWAAAVTR